MKKVSIKIAGNRIDLWRAEMKTRQLGDLTVSEVGMGCMAFSHGYGKIPPEQYSIEAIRNAYQHGCTLFDTA